MLERWLQSSGMEPIALVPVDAVQVTTAVDNSSDVLMPDPFCGPDRFAVRAGLRGRLQLQEVDHGRLSS